MRFTSRIRAAMHERLVRIVAGGRTGSGAPARADRAGPAGAGRGRGRSGRAGRRRTGRAGRWSSWVSTENPTTLPGAVAGGPERIRQASPPVLEDGDRLGRLRGRGDLVDRRPVGLARRIDEVQVLGRREERLADGRVLEDVEQVRGVAPHLVGRRPRHLVAELPPGGDPVPPGPVGIRRPEVGGDDLADGVVDHEPVGAQLDERQAAQPLEGVLGRGVREHRGDQRECRPPHDRRGVEGPAGRRVEAGQVELGQLLDDGGDRRRVVVERRVRRRAPTPRAAATAGGLARAGGSARRRRRATPSRRSSASASSRGRLPSGRLRNRGPIASGPAGHRRLATREDDADAVVEGRDERSAGATGRAAAAPRIGRARGRPASPRLASRPTASSAVARSPPVAAEIASRNPRAVGSIAPQSSRRTIAPAAAGLGREGLEQGRLADPADAVDEDDRAARRRRAADGGARARARARRGPCPGRRCARRTVRVMSSPAECAPASSPPRLRRSRSGLERRSRRRRQSPVSRDRSRATHGSSRS